MNFLNLTNLENKPLLKYIIIGVIAVNAIVLALLLLGPGRMSAAASPGNGAGAEASGDTAGTTGNPASGEENEAEGDDRIEEDREEEYDSDTDWEAETEEENASSDNSVSTTAETAEAAAEEESTTGPILELNTDRVTLNVGDYFNYWDYIETVRDRDGSDLSQYIHLSNTPNMYTPGEYTVTYRLTSPATGETSSKDLVVTVE